VAGLAPRVKGLYNPGLKTSDIMVLGLAGLILLFGGMVITSLGVVRERQAGTLEQLAVVPLRPRDVFLGKIAPYFLVAAADLAIVVALGVALFRAAAGPSVRAATIHRHPPHARLRAAGPRPVRRSHPHGEHGLLVCRVRR
jgi:ABC-2 family transporter protein